MKLLVFTALVVASVAAKDIQWKMAEPQGLRPSHYNIHANDNGAGAAGGVKFPVGPGTGSLSGSYDKAYRGPATGGVGAGISYPVGKNTDIYAQGSVSKTEHFPSNYQGMVGVEHRFPG